MKGKLAAKFGHLNINPAALRPGAAPVMKKKKDDTREIDHSAALSRPTIPTKSRRRNRSSLTSRKDIVGTSVQTADDSHTFLTDDVKSQPTVIGDNSAVNNQNNSVPIESTIETTLGYDRDSSTHIDDTVDDRAADIDVVTTEPVSSPPVTQSVTQETTVVQREIESKPESKIVKKVESKPKTTVKTTSANKDESKTKENTANEWKPPKWEHMAHPSDTSFLEPRKLLHGDLELEKKQSSIDRRHYTHDYNGKKRSQRFMEMLDEMRSIENSKLALLRNTSLEIDRLRVDIQRLSNNNRKRIPQSVVNPLFGLFSIWNTEGSGTDVAPKKKKKNKKKKTKDAIVDFDSDDEFESYLNELRRSKIELAINTSNEMAHLKQILHLFHKAGVTKLGSIANANDDNSDDSWALLPMIIAALVVSTTVVAL